MNAISSGAMRRTVDVNAPEKNWRLLNVHENGTNLGQYDFMAASPPGARSKISDSVFKNPGIYIYTPVFKNIAT